jgi:hypothetical protein
MPSTDRKLELKAKTSMAQTASQTAVYAKGLHSSLLRLSRSDHGNECTTMTERCWNNADSGKLTYSVKRISQ